MRSIAIILTVCLAVAASTFADQPTSDLDKLQGEWQVTQFVACGSEFPKNVVDHLIVVIKGDRLSYTLPRFDDPTRPSNVKVDTEIVVGPGTPQTIDVRMVQGRNKSDPLRGVYELRGDTLRICLSSGEPGAGDKRVTTLGPSKASRATQLSLKRCPDSNYANKIAGHQLAR